MKWPPPPPDRRRLQIPLGRMVIAWLGNLGVGAAMNGRGPVIGGLLSVAGIAAAFAYVVPAITASVVRRVGIATAWRLTDVAALIGGRKRAWRREEYRRILDTARDDGRPGRTLLRHAAGFVAASLAMRARDAVRVAGRVLDWFLAKPRTEYLAGTAGALTAAYFVRLGGVASLAANLDNVLASAVVVYGAGFFLRERRHVPPVAPRRKRE